MLKENVKKNLKAVANAYLTISITALLANSDKMLTSVLIGANNKPKSLAHVY